MGKKPAATEPVQATTTEKRIKLSNKQYTLLSDAIKLRNDAGKAFDDANRNLNTISTLIMDAHQLDESVRAQLDDTTHELFYTITEAPSEAAPA